MGTQTGSATGNSLRGQSAGRYTILHLPASWCWRPTTGQDDGSNKQSGWRKSELDRKTDWIPIFAIPAAAARPYEKLTSKVTTRSQRRTRGGQIGHTAVSRPRIQAEAQVYTGFWYRK